MLLLVNSIGLEKNPAALILYQELLVFTMDRVGVTIACKGELRLQEGLVLRAKP